MNEPEEPNVEEEPAPEGGELEVVTPEELEVEAEELEEAPRGGGLRGWLGSLSTPVLFGLVFAVFAAVLLGVLFGVLGAVTGKSGPAKPKIHKLADVQRCLEKKNVRVTTSLPANQLIASTALGGALLAVVKGNSAIVMLAGGEQEALNLYYAQADVAPPRLKPRLGDILFRQGDVVVLWAVGPTTDQATPLADCLK